MGQLEYWPCYNSYIKKTEKLSDQEVGRLFRALMRYSATGERQELEGRESIAFDFIADGTFWLWQTGIDSERAKTQRPGRR